MVLSRMDYFVGVQVWPAGLVLRPEQWLKNFTDEELPYATHLLNAFMYFPTRMVDRILACAFQDASMQIAPEAATYEEKQATWDVAINHCLFTYPTGETPNPTDSGFAFARKARQVLGIPEETIVHPDEAILRLAVDPDLRLIFVDDFVGTGNQFLATWARTYEYQDGTQLSLSACASRGTVIYCPAFSTDRGLAAIQAQAPEVLVSPGHILTEDYSPISPQSRAWPEDLVHGAVDFIREASLRAGIPDSGGALPSDWRGFGALGLAMAIDTSVPDATLPIFYWQGNDWHPLVQRR